MLLDGCEESLVLQNKAVLNNGELHIQKLGFRGLHQMLPEDQTILWRLNNQKGETQVWDSHNRNNFSVVVGDSEINMGQRKSNNLNIRGYIYEYQKRSSVDRKAGVMLNGLYKRSIITNVTLCASQNNDGDQTTSCLLPATPHSKRAVFRLCLVLSDSIFKSNI